MIIRGRFCYHIQTSIDVLVIKSRKRGCVLVCVFVDKVILRSSLIQCVKGENVDKEFGKKSEVILLSYKREMLKSSLTYRSRWSAVGITTYISAT